MSAFTSAWRVLTLMILSILFTTPAVHAVGTTTVDAGYDLLTTQSGTQLAGIPLTGVPLGSYNFGGMIGTQSTGDADTIVQRLANASLPLPSIPGDAPAINIQLDALQMVTASPVSFGGGPLGLYYVTLQSTDGTGPVSTGQMTVDFSTPTSGTFNSFFDVFFDIRFGSPNGPIVASSDSVLTNSGDTWQSTPPDANDVLINGVNSMLNGGSTASDFWPIGNITHSGNNASHVVRNAEILPEPGSLLILGVTALALWRRSH